MQILSGKLTAKQEFYQRNPVRQGFDKNLTPQYAPIIGKTYKNTRMQKVSKLKKYREKAL